jgi:hypothetical protein
MYFDFRKNEVLFYLYTYTISRQILPHEIIDISVEKRLGLGVNYNPSKLPDNPIYKE